ncbi:hypothetical protein HJC23_008017 [Cyclotella cryptica]|uniref:HSF-type DNA-binding domain-containing protein n=1 Tax=Cyclotella cryptica TaxID=29204 RepID=A0ABD3Q3L7_9STRA|eukprot:CCRYP_009132-RA/>CCRYP_009132-RA protein AED:0.00 eAED:0.00 QI:182/-1/1/1/-1/1/1/165/393
MNTGRIDPLAILAIEADARARAVQETDKQAFCMGTSTSQIKCPSMILPSATPCHPIPIGRPEAHVYSSNVGQVVYPSIKETQLTEASYRDGHMPSLPSVASTSTRLGLHRSSPLPAISCLGPSSAPSSPAQEQSNRRKPSFALKLHALLADKNCRSAITWMPSGKSFCILDKEEFANKWLPKYFGEAKFESFSRRLKRWGFHKMFVAGQSQVAYFHDHFQRDRLDLSKMMKGNGSNRINGSLGEVFDPEQYENFSTHQEIAELKRLAEALKRDDVHNRERQYQLQMTPPPPHSRQVSLAHPWSTFVMDRSAIAARPYHQKCYIDPAPMTTVGFQPQDSRRNIMRHQMRACRSSDTSVANELVNIEDDISRCEEQLAILNRLKMLKEQYYACYL